MYDLDYDYEHTPDETRQEWREYEDIDGKDYSVEVTVNEWCIRKGNYSSRAADPDEYYGEWKTTFDITDASVYCNDREDWVEIDPDDLPKEVKDAIDYEFEE
jgi:hypothetical protein